MNPPQTGRDRDPETGPDRKPETGSEQPWEIEDTIDQLLDQLPAVSYEDALVMAQLWEEEDAAGRRVAWQRAKAAIQRSKLTEVLNRARDDVGFWMQASRSDFQGIGGLLGQEGDHVSVRRAAAPAVLDAVAALLAERELQGSDFDLLTRPWRIATEHEDVDDGDGVGSGNDDVDADDGEAGSDPHRPAEE